MRERSVCAVAVVCLAGSAAPAFAGEHGTILFESDRAGGEQTDVWTMSVHGRHLVNLTAGSPVQDGNASWRPDGRRIAFATFRDATLGGGEFNAEIYTMRADGSKPANLTQSPAFDILPDWRPS